MTQPTPRLQFGHHTPAGLSISAIAMTLQHSMQLPHSRPGTVLGPDGSAMEAVSDCSSDVILALLVADPTGSPQSPSLAFRRSFTACGLALPPDAFIT